MDGGLVQSLAVALIVLAAALFLGRRAWRTVAAARRASAAAGCGADGGCGCHSAGETVDSEALTKRG